MHAARIEISFGDCDPAGIVFYPNYLRWFDQTFQSFLNRLDLGHADIVERFDAVGAGLIDCGARFRAPAIYGDILMLDMTIDAWSGRTLKLAYRGRVDDTPVVEGYEVRGLFVRRDGTLTAAPIAPLRALIEGAIARDAAEKGASNAG